MQNISLPAPAKLNLFLHIISRRDDGYHNIQTLFQLLDWSDNLHFHVRSDDEISLTSNMNGVPDKDNLVIRAANLLRQKTGCSKGIDIEMEKRLPIGAGVGGGSSNAATTLLALNYLWQTQLTHNDLLELGRELGADVPVFIYGHSAWAEGVGDELSAMILPERWYVLLIPEVQIKTSALFKDPRLSLDSDILSIDHYHPDQGHNDFEKLLRFDYAEIAHALDWLGQFAKARVTGTGSVVFAGFDSKEEAGTIAAQAPSAYKVHVVKGLNESPLRKLFG